MGLYWRTDRRNRHKGQPVTKMSRVCFILQGGTRHEGSVPTNWAARWQWLPKQLGHRGEVVILFCGYIQVTSNPSITWESHQPARGTDKVNASQCVLRRTPSGPRSFTSKGRQRADAKLMHPSMEEVPITGLSVGRSCTSALTQHRSNPAVCINAIQCASSRWGHLGHA
jgi:hypothetical protein